jgi:hypothetical protein
MTRKQLIRLLVFTIGATVVTAVAIYLVQRSVPRADVFEQDILPPSDVQVRGLCFGNRGNYNLCEGQLSFVVTCKSPDYPEVSDLDFLIFKQQTPTLDPEDLAYVAEFDEVGTITAGGDKFGESLDDPAGLYRSRECIFVDHALNPDEQTGYFIYGVAMVEKSTGTISSTKWARPFQLSDDRPPQL